MYKLNMILFQDGPMGTMCELKLGKHLDNPFIENGQKQTVVDMKGIYNIFLRYIYERYDNFFNFQMLWC